ncbi:MAG: HYR domain-containing protein, partial [Acidobacteriota bacterium]|nr:HYR domain-containing protein [Acidobacteriota bacterium]
MRLTQTHTRRALTLGAIRNLLKARHLLLGVGLLGAALMLAGPSGNWLRPVKAASTYFVRTDGSNATCNGLTNASAASAPNCAFQTIQFAVTTAAGNAMSGDVINVAAGTYAEAVTVGEVGLTINGPNVNINACTGTRVGEAIVGNATGSFNITASNVVINGFTLSGNTNGAFFGFAVLIGPAANGVQVLNNIITNNIAGIALGGDNATIRGNAIRMNNNAGPISGTGIYTDQFNTGGTTIVNATIDNNCFNNNDNVAVLIGSTDPALGASGITISNNTFNANGNAVLLFNTTASSITRNTITGSLGSQVVAGGGVNGLQITENFIDNGTTRGIRIGDFGGGGTNSNIVLSCDHIQGNPTAGLEIDAAAGSYTGTLSAQMVWWGSPTGPTHPSNPGGTGQVIVDPGNQVSFTPFLTSGTDGDPATPGFQCINCMVTCPTNITKSNDPNQCGAVVTYAAPTPSGICGTITCSPASGSFFPVGTTTVTCTSSIGPTCTFTVTVQDTQAPAIATCPTNKTVPNDPNQCGAVVTYTPPTASDNCPGASVICTPFSGS